MGFAARTLVKNSFLLLLFFSLPLPRALFCFFFSRRAPLSKKKKKSTMWRDLPPDLANLVFEELDAPEDRAAFRMACRYLFLCPWWTRREASAQHLKV